jgi:8-oxo-dGTP pyrophosphatase MutT (NUDIX family)
LIVGLDRKALDALEANSLAPKSPSTRGMPLRPRDAASILLLDATGGVATPGNVRVLMGRRRADLAFMPNQFVFPGGRTDPDDASSPVAGALQDADSRRLIDGMGRAGSARRAQALAVTALRECFEETGQMIGRIGTNQEASALFHGSTVQPDISPLRYIARAITPPGRVRRFDTRFFAAWRGDVAAEAPDGPPDAEFSQVKWVTIAEAAELDCPEITRTILAALVARLERDPALTGHPPIPEYRMRHGRFVCEWR